MASAGDVDRISALPDDLLHLILSFVGDAQDVTRTAALSRRWRRVWIHAQHLALVSDADRAIRRRADDAVQFVGFVDWVLDQRGDADIQSLDIGLHGRRSAAAYTPPDKVNRWLRYAMQRVVKSFRLVLTHGMPGSPLRVDEPAVVLPDRGRMTTMTLYLTSCYVFQLPVAASARYEALTQLTLSCASFSGDELSTAGRTLGDFVSTCCPRLRKLDISFLRGLPQLAIRSKALQEFTLRNAEDLRVLDVTAPNLRALELRGCFGDGSDENVTVNKTRVASSWGLQEIGLHHHPYRRRPGLEIQGLRSVRRLRHLRVSMHGQYYARTTDVGFWLLENCPNVEHVDVKIDHYPSPSSVIEGDVVADLTLEGAAPFASVRSMDITVCAHQFPDHHLVPSIFALLLRCPRLRSLRIEMRGYTLTCAWWWRRCFCDGQHAWTDDRAISLESLQEVKIIGFSGSDEDMDLVSLLFASCKKSIKSMTLANITKNLGTVSLKRIMAEDGDGTETIDQKLMNIPTVDRGRWHFGDTVYTWTCYAT